MDLYNIFDYANKQLITKNAIIYIQEISWYLLILSINIEDNTYNYYSDEWISLINYNYPHCSYYSIFVNSYNNIIQNLNYLVYHECNVLSLITTFSTGCVHGYSGFWYILINYITNIDKYNNLNLIVYKDSEKGMLQILDHLKNKGIITANIIYLEKNIKYKFNSVTYIPNEYHVINGNLDNMIYEFIQKYNIINKSIYFNDETICILKSNISNTNVSNNGIFDDKLVEEFCNKYNIYRLFPKNEIETINKINNCRILIINYGSTFFKNFIYISNKCEKIIVVVHGDVYINDYYHLSSITPSKFQGVIYNRYKNADIKYIIVNNELNFNPYLL